MYKAALTLSVITFLTCVASFLNQLLIANYFGASILLDSYFIAVSVPSFVLGVVSGILYNSLVPLLVREQNSRPDFFNHYCAMIFGFSLCLAVFFPAIGYFVVPVIISYILPPEMNIEFDNVVFLSRISWISVGCIFLIGSLSSFLNAIKCYFIPALIGLLPYLGMVTLLILNAPFPGIESLVLGMLLGHIFSIPILYIAVSKSIKLSMFSFFKFFNHFHFRNIQSSVVLLILHILSILSFTVFGIIDAFWLSRLGEKYLSYFNYSLKILVSVGSIIVLGPVTVLTPYLSLYNFQLDKKLFLDSVYKATKLIFIFSSVTTVLISFNGLHIITFLFQRGSFTKEITSVVSLVLPFLSFGMMAMVGAVLMFKALFASKDIIGAAIISTTGTIFYYSLAGFLSKRYGLWGIVFSYIITWWLIFILSLLKLFGTTINVYANNILNYFLKLSLSLLCSGMAMYFFKIYSSMLHSSSYMFGLILNVILPISIGLFVFVLVSNMFINFIEVKELCKSIFSKNNNSL